MPKESEMRDLYFFLIGALTVLSLVVVLMSMSPKPEPLPRTELQVQIDSLIIDLRVLGDVLEEIERERISEMLLKCEEC
jgi:hypothetical protein